MSKGNSHIPSRAIADKFKNFLFEMVGDDTNSFHARFFHGAQDVIQSRSTVDFQQRFRRNVGIRALTFATSRGEQNCRLYHDLAVNPSPRGNGERPSPVSTTKTLDGSSGCLAENFSAISLQASCARSRFARATTQPP